jgi:tripartite-type tricarboxylate transporter receptor subunit TctC
MLLSTRVIDCFAQGPGHTRNTVAAVLALGLGLGAVPSEAQDAAKFPEKPVRIIVALTPGGSVDLVARLLAPEMSKHLGQPVVVENRPGGGGTIGVEVAANSPADGYTLIMGSSSSFGIGPNLHKTPYDPLAFEAISFISYAPNVLVVPASLPVKSVDDLVKLAKSKPGALNFASSGVGGSPHLAAELFKRAAGADIEHVPYTGGGQPMPDLLAGRVDMSFSTLIAAQEHIAAGSLRALAVTTPQRVPLLPDVPTMAEAGYPDVEISAWNGLLAPPGTPKPIVDTLSTAVQKAVASPEFAEKLRADGTVPVGGTAEQFDAYVNSEIKRWGELIRAIGLKVE